MGKSQLVFALGGEGRKLPRPWFYWPLGANTTGSQWVYQNFSSIVYAFDSMEKKDETNHHEEEEEEEEEEDVLDCDSFFYQTQKLWTHGFILELLRYCFRVNKGSQMIRIEKQSFKVIKSDLEAVDAVRSQMETDGKVLPFFILDEMRPSRKDKKVSAFQLNVFRACGLIVVVMGTDGNISNLVTKARHSRSNPCWWMSVVSSFPTYQFIPFHGTDKNGAWKRAIALHPVVEDITKHSRGLFSRYFVDAVVQFFVLGKDDNETFELADLLDEAFETVSKKTQKVKDFMSTQEGRDAQLMALS
ncbi:hypothetical protein P3T76_004423 [Phytophthora citrophthora]|uniref:Crinkler (CRN) family protein n=1 Tax=Phytophthora citrophthora TaxID=4793 RepID=A0AAD9LQB2_9STRA|nr:hypothetical protein P3T76_004423 [Phytophthora citrophthora]